VSAARRFHERLLELLPVYTDAGRRIARLRVDGTGADARPTPWALADKACRDWLRGAIPPQDDAFDAVVEALASLCPVSGPSSAMDAVEVARDARRIAEPLAGAAGIARTAWLAEATGYAAARGDALSAAGNAADCLFSRKADAGEEYVVSEAVVLYATSAD
jgi:hypothetical protein